MDITFGVIMTKEFPDSHSNAVRKIDNVLSKGLPDFKSDFTSVRINSQKRLPSTY